MMASKPLDVDFIDPLLEMYKSVDGCPAPEDMEGRRNKGSRCAPSQIPAANHYRA